MNFHREKDHMKCIHYKKYNICVCCKRFYMSSTNDKELEDLYIENKRSKV